MRWLPWLCVTYLAGGCAALGGVTDGTSLALGTTNGGRLVQGTRIPDRGDGFLVPARWRLRGNLWGTEELVSLVVRAARRVARERPGSPLYVCDLSPAGGGASLWHRSHQTGRDVDLLFYALDAAGRPAPPPEDMVRFGPDGASTATNPSGWRQPRLRLDVPRNWALVRALLTDDWIDVQYVFVSDPIRELLLAHATAIGEPLDLIVRAREVLRQPVNALPHDDHFHVRIFCSADDLLLGCVDRGALRWLKKPYKYRLLGFAARLPAVLQPFVAAVVSRPLGRGLLAHAWQSPAAAFLGRARPTVAWPWTPRGAHVR